MDDIENDAILLLSLLDENIFPHFLEWNKDQKDLSKWILFLLQTDFLQFKGLMNGKEDQSRMAQFTYHIKHANQRYPLLTDRELVSLDRLCKSNIPFKVALAPICQHIWRTAMIRTRQLASSKYWTIMHSKIVTDQDTLDLDFVLSNEIYRRYLDRFLQNVPAELGALQCLLNARRLLHRIERFISHQPIVDPNHKKIEESKSHTPSIFTWRTSMKAMSGAYPYFSANSAASSGTDKLVGGTVNNFVPSSTASSSSSTPSVSSSVTHGKETTTHLSVPHIIVFNDPIEALKVLLFGMRSLQREFFPTAATTFPSSNSSTLGNRHSSSNVMSRPSSNPAQHSSGYPPHAQSHNSPPKPHNSSSSGHNNSSNMLDGPNICAGLSDTSRVEIMAVLAQHTAVKAMSEVDSLDVRFASSAAKTIYDLLLKLERECYQFLQQKFSLFVQSQEYMKLTALLHCEKKPQVWKYLDRTSFLEGRVHREELLHWASSEASGVLYLPLHANEDIEEDDDGDKQKIVGKEAYFVDMVTIDEKEQLAKANKPNKKKARVKVNFFEDRENPKTKPSEDNEADSKSNKKNEQDMGSDFAIDAPPVFALHFSACLPEFTALNQESLAIVPHRMRLWATDTAVLPSMKKFRVSKSSANTSPNLRPSQNNNAQQRRDNKDKERNPSKAKHFFSDNEYDISSPAPKESNNSISSKSNPAKFSKSAIIRELSGGNHASTDDADEDLGKDNDGGGGVSNGVKPGVKFAGIPSPKGRHMIQLDNEFRFSTASLDSDTDNAIANGDKDKTNEENMPIPSMSLLKKSLSVDSNASSVYSAEELVTGYEGDDLVLSVSKDIGDKVRTHLPSVGVRQPSYGDTTTNGIAAQNQIIDGNSNDNNNVNSVDDENDDEDIENSSDSDSDSDSDEEDNEDTKKGKKGEEDEEDDLGELLGAGEVDENGLPLDLDQAFAANDKKDDATNPSTKPNIQSKRMSLLELHSEKIDRSVRQKMQVAQHYASQGYHPHHDHSQCHYPGMTPLHSELGSPASVCGSLNQQGSLFHDHSSHYLDNAQLGALTMILLNQLWRCNLQQDVDLEVEQDNHHFVLLKSMELQVLYQHIFGTTLSTRHSLGQLFLSVHSRLVHSNPELRQALTTIQPHSLAEGNFLHLSRGKYRKIVHVSLVYAPVAAFSASSAITTPIPYRSCYQFMQHVALGMQSRSYLPQRRMDSVTGVLVPTSEANQYQSNSVKNNSDRILPFSPNAESKTQESPLPVPTVQLPSAMKQTQTVVDTNQKKKSSATSILSGLIVVKPYKMLVYDDQCSYYHHAIKEFTAKLPPAFVARNDPVATIAPNGPNTDPANNVDVSDKHNTPEMKQRPYDWTEETLYDLYLRYPSHDKTPNYATTKETKDSDASTNEHWSMEERMLTITRHCGICDFSMAGVLTTISTRLWLQIMMLVLTDRKVMLVSSSPTLLSKVYFMLHRLIWPFKITQTSTEPFGDCDRMSNDHNDIKSPHLATPFPNEYPHASPHHHPRNHFQAKEDPALQAYYAYILDYRAHDPFFTFLHTSEELFDYFGILPHESFYASHPSLFYLQKQRTMSSSVPVTPMNLSTDPDHHQAQTQTQTHALHHAQSLRPFQQLARAFSGHFTPVAGTTGNNNSFTLQNHQPNVPSTTGTSNKTQSLLQGIVNTNPGSNVASPDGTPSTALLSPTQSSATPMLKQAHANNHSSNNFLGDSSDQSPNLSRTFSNTFTGANSGTTATHHVPHPNAVSATSPSVFSRIVCVDVRAYRQAQRMLQSAQSIQMPFHFPADYDDQLYTVIDLDTSQQIQGGLLKRDVNGPNAASSRSPRNDNNANEENGNGNNNACSEYSLLDLRNDLLFRTANFPAFRELHNQIQTSTMDLFHTVIAAQLLTKPPPNNNNNTNNNPSSASTSSTADTASSFSSESTGENRSSAVSSLTKPGFSSAESMSSAVSSINPSMSYSTSMKSTSSAAVKRRQAMNVSQSSQQYSSATSLFGRVGFKAEEYHHSPSISLRSSQRLLQQQQQQQSQKASEKNLLRRQQGRKLGKRRQIEDDDDDEDYEEEHVHQIVNADDIRLFKHTDSIASIASVLTGAHLTRTHSALIRPGSRLVSHNSHHNNTSGSKLTVSSSGHSSHADNIVENNPKSREKRNDKDGKAEESSSGGFGRRDSSKLSLLSPQDSGLWSSFNQSQRILFHLFQRPFHQLPSSSNAPVVPTTVSDNNTIPEVTILIERFHEQIALEIAAIRASNVALEHAFHQFWMVLLLQAIPETLHYDPHAAVLGCDMQALLALLLTRNHGELRLTHHKHHHHHHHHHQHHQHRSNSTASPSPHLTHFAPESAESSMSTISSAMGSSLYPSQHNSSYHTNPASSSHHESSSFFGTQSGHPKSHSHHGRHHRTHQALAYMVNGYTAQEIQHLPFEDFLTLYNDHTANAGVSLPHAWYAECLAGLSSSFVDLIQRHGAVLVRHAY